MYHQRKEFDTHSRNMIEKENRVVLPSDPEVLGCTSPRIIVWRSVNGFMTCFFLFAAVVQINDPDPYIWIPIYLIPALLSGTIVWRPTTSESCWWRLLCLLHLTACFGGAIYLTVVVVQLLKKELSNPLMTEEGRELAGLLIIGCWLAIGLCAGHLSNSPNPKRCMTTVFLVISCFLGVTPLFCWSMCFVSSFSALSHCIQMKTTAADSNSSIDSNDYTLT